MNEVLVEMVKNDLGGKIAIIDIGKKLVSKLFYRGFVNKNYDQFVVLKTSLPSGISIIVGTRKYVEADDRQKFLYYLYGPYFLDDDDRMDG